MKIAMTGASGFVGRALTMRLVDRGDTVIAARRRSREKADLSWDVEGGFDPTTALAGYDAVVHLAGENVATRWTDDAKRSIRRSRVLGTRSVVRALSDAGDRRPKTLVCASAVGYYGTGDGECDETSPAGDDFLAEVTRAWEEEADKAAELEGVRVVKLRLGVVLGPGGGALAKMLPAFRFGVGGKIGDGSQWMSWVHVDDAVAAFETALHDENLEGAHNVTAPTPVTNDAFTKALGSALRRPTFMRVPAFAVGAAFGEMGETILLDGQRVVPRKLLDAGFRFRFVTVDEALTDIVGK